MMSAADVIATRSSEGVIAVVPRPHPEFAVVVTIGSGPDFARRRPVKAKSEEHKFVEASDP